MARKHGLVSISSPARWNGQNLLLAGVIILAIYLIVVPLLFLLWSSFRSAPIGFPSALTLENYASAYGDSRTYALFGTTLVFAVSSSALSLFFGVIFAWLLERTNVPFKEGLYALMPVPIAVPGVLFSIGWVLLLSPQIGVINMFLRRVFALEDAPINIYSLPGMIFLEGLHLTPVTFLMVAGAFRRMDPALEEASAVAGGGLFRTLWGVTLRILWPSILAAYIYVLISAMESFEIPGVIGMRAGIHVIALRIYLAASQPPTNYGLVSTYAVSLLLISAVLIYFYGKILGQAERFATITGKAYRPKVIDLGVWKYAALAVFAGYFLATVILPFLVLLWASLLPFYQVPSVPALARLSWENYHAIWEFPKVGLAFRNTRDYGFARSHGDHVDLLGDFLVYYQKSRAGTAAPGYSHLLTPRHPGNRHGCFPDVGLFDSSRADLWNDLDPVYRLCHRPDLFQHEGDERRDDPIAQRTGRSVIYQRRLVVENIRAHHTALAYARIHQWLDIFCYRRGQGHWIGDSDLQSQYDRGSGDGLGAMEQW